MPFEAGSLVKKKRMPFEAGTLLKKMNAF